MLYQATYQSNAGYLEASKSRIKVSESHNGAVGYHKLLAAVALQEKYNITSNTANEDHKVEEKINTRDIYLTFQFLSKLDNFSYKQLNTQIKNKYIMGMGRYPQYLLGFITLINNYIP